MDPVFDVDDDDAVVETPDGEKDVPDANDEELPDQVVADPEE
jgi:hypothetical protein